MGSVLSQDEVDALLQGVAGDDVVSDSEGDDDEEYDGEIKLDEEEAKRVCELPLAVAF